MKLPYLATQSPTILEIISHLTRERRLADPEVALESAVCSAQENILLNETTSAIPDFFLGKKAFTVTLKAISSGFL